jgi:hypothetical protein
VRGRRLLLLRQQFGEQVWAGFQLAPLAPISLSGVASSSAIANRPSAARVSQKCLDSIQVVVAKVLDNDAHLK